VLLATLFQKVSVFQFVLKTVNLVQNQPLVTNVKTLTITNSHYSKRNVTNVTSNTVKVVMDKPRFVPKVVTLVTN